MLNFLGGAAHQSKPSIDQKAGKPVKMVHIDRFPGQREQEGGEEWLWKANRRYAAQMYSLSQEKSVQKIRKILIIGF